MAPVILIWAALAAFLADQVSKYVVVHSMGLARVQLIDVLPPLLTFRYGENRGINFGLFNGDSETQRWLLIGFSFFVVIAAAVWILRSKASRFAQLSGGFLIGGALGNVADRLIYGYVLDFLNMSCCGIQNPFVFNIADVFIFLGAAGLVFADMKAPVKKAT